MTSLDSALDALVAHIYPREGASSSAPSKAGSHAHTHTHTHTPAHTQAHEITDKLRRGGIRGVDVCVCVITYALGILTHVAPDSDARVEEFVALMHALAGSLARLAPADRAGANAALRAAWVCHEEAAKVSSPPAEASRQRSAGTTATVSGAAVGGLAAVKAAATAAAERAGSAAPSLSRAESTTEHSVKLASVKEPIMDALIELQDEIENAGGVISTNLRDLLDPHDVVLVYSPSKLLVSALKTKHLQIFVAEGAAPAASHAAAAALASASRSPVIIPDSSIAAVMHRVSKVILQAHSVAANGDAVVDAGGHAIAMCARQHGVPVIVVCNQIAISPVPDAATFSVDTQVGNPQDIMPLEVAMGFPEDVEVVNMVYDTLQSDDISVVVTDAQTIRTSQLASAVRDLYGGVVA